MGLGWTQIVFRYYESSDMLLLPAVLYIVEDFSARPLYPTHINYCIKCKFYRSCHDIFVTNTFFFSFHEEIQYI